MTLALRAEHLADLVQRDLEGDDLLRIRLFTSAAERRWPVAMMS